MHVSNGTILALYYGTFLYVFYILNRTKSTPSTNLLLALPSLLFITFFPYFLETEPFLKFLLTIVGFFTSFSIVDLTYLEPVSGLSFKDYMFILSTSSRPIYPTPPKASEAPLVSSSFSPNFKALWTLVGAAGKLLMLAAVFETIQHMDLSVAWKYYLFYLALGISLLLCFIVLLDVVGVFWEFVFNMKTKTLFNAPYISSSPRDFWSRRWNMFFRDFFHKVFFKNAKSLSYARTTVYALAIFVISGVLHEYVHWAILGHFSGHNLMFFLVHGIVTTAQVAVQTTFPVLKKGVPRVAAIALNYVFLALTMPLFMGPYVQAGFVREVNLPITIMPTVHRFFSHIYNSV